MALYIYLSVVWRMDLSVANIYLLFLFKNVQLAYDLSLVEEITETENAEIIKLHQEFITLKN